MLRLLRLRKCKFAAVPAGIPRDWSPSPGRSILIHVGAEIGQQQARRRPRDAMAQLEDT